MSRRIRSPELRQRPRPLAQRMLGWLERLVYRDCGIAPDEEMSWRNMPRQRWSSASRLLLVYGLQRVQHVMPEALQLMPVVS